MILGTAQIIQGNALALPLPDNSVDLICTSPPYFGLRSYQDGGAHYEGQIGSEATPAEFLDALIAATREMVRVLKPSGSIWINLGDKYSGGSSGDRNNGFNERSGNSPGKRAQEKSQVRGIAAAGMRPKTLIGIPWRYAIACIDQLGLILRAEIIWAKPNGLPESVTDRVRRSHEQWFHLTKAPRYFAAVDEIREPHTWKRDPSTQRLTGTHGAAQDRLRGADQDGMRKYMQHETAQPREYNPLGKLPGSVWTVPTQPLEVPPELGVDHFAAFPMEWPRRIIQGWTPTGICTECGEGRRPSAARELIKDRGGSRIQRDWNTAVSGGDGMYSSLGHERIVTITGYMCGCSTPAAPTRPAAVLDPFMGTGTTLVVARALGRNSIGVDLSADYCRLAQWRVNNPGQLAAALQVEKPDVIPAGQLSLFEDGMP